MNADLNTIAGVLVKHGYSLAGISPDYVRVNDPVRNCDNPPRVTGYNVVEIRDWPQCYKFIEERR